MTYRNGLGSYSAEFFETLRPGGWTASMVDVAAAQSVSPSQYNPTMSTDPFVVAQVNQMLANGINPLTGHPTALNLAVTGKRYRWEGAGDIVNPYTGQHVGNAFDLGAAGVAALPEAFNAQAAWEELDRAAASKGYTLGADGSLQSPTGAVATRVPSFQQIVQEGRPAFDRAAGVLANLSVAAGSASAVEYTPSVPEPVQPPPSSGGSAGSSSGGTYGGSYGGGAPSGPPAGWRWNGENGWWGPDGKFYEGSESDTPWSNGQVGVSVTTFTQQPPPPPIYDPVVPSPVSPYPTGGGEGGDAPPVQAAGVGGGGVGLLIGLGLLGALIVGVRKRGRS